MTDDPFKALQIATRTHRETHGCGAYTFEDGPGLARISEIAKPARILELGTALGYTACCLASGSPAATVDTIDGDPEHAALAREQIAAVGLADRITVHVGDFEKVLAGLTDVYDMVFFDGFAPSTALLSLLRSRMASDGTLICANIGLAGDRQKLAIMDDLNNPIRWRSLGSIEQEQTLVVQKI